LGYAVGLDMTRRDLQREAKQRGLPWEIGKAFDHSAPCGPIRTVVSVGHVLEGGITLAVNGSIKQKGNLREMIWNVPEIISNLSTQYALAPGDLIFTGTPSGVGPVVPGDRLEGTIDRLGSLRITIGPREE
jgi:fumarylpyruvate hydrolase